MRVSIQRRKEDDNRGAQLACRGRYSWLVSA